MNDDRHEEWLLLKVTKNGLTHFVGVMPRLPEPSVRSAFPVRVEVSVQYEANDAGLPMYDDDLKTLNDLGEDIRSWDPARAVFQNAMRETGGGARTWTLYATSEQEFVALVPPNDLFAISALPDPTWDAVDNVLAAVRR